MAKVIKAKDWSTTPLGPIETWPPSLRTTVSLAQASSSPISLAWGSGHTQIYNDGYRPICGAKHPTAMGQDFRECWASAWPVIGESYASALAGRSAQLEKLRMFLDRFGVPEETWFAFAFSPVTDESGRIVGLFNPVTEMTTLMLSERRTQTVRDLARRCGDARTTEHAFELATALFAEANLDVPFTVFYALDAGATRARRCACSGITADAAGPEVIDLAVCAPPWSIRDAVRSGAVQLVDTLRLDGPVGPYPELPRQALVLPIWAAGWPSPVAVMVAGVSARLMLTDAYRVFYDLVASTVAGAVTGARTREDARRKTEQLAELERAHRELEAFSYSVSHDLRAPLRAIDGFSQILLDPDDDIDDARRRGLLTRIHANALRMSSIIDDLLSLSQISVTKLHRTPVDLTAIALRVVAELRARHPARDVDVRVAQGLAATCDSRLATIVLEHLLGNAWKFTSKLRHAEIVVDREPGRVFTVHDNGAGFDMAHSKHLFEPFKRLHAANEFEGTGVGLALVRRIVERHGGQVWAHGEVGRGATVRFTLEPLQP